MSILTSQDIRVLDDILYNLKVSYDFKKPIKQPSREEIQAIDNLRHDIEAAKGFTALLEGRAIEIRNLEAHCSKLEKNNATLEAQVKELNDIRNTPAPLQRIQQEQKAWSIKNFPNNKATHNLLGVVEEVGELSHAHLKKMQNIRTNQDHDNDTVDAIGDILIYLLGYCNIIGVDALDILTQVWDTVRQRDWTKNKIDGKV